jgi:thiol:disulfide interchange protein
MVKKFAILACLGVFAFASQLNWQNNIPRGNEKPVMVLVEKESCPWCKRMKSQTLQDDKVVTALQKYDTVLISLERWNRMGFESVTSVPTVFFLDNEKRVVKKVVGFWEANDFLVDIRAADKKLQH